MNPLLSPAYWLTHEQFVLPIMLILVITGLFLRLVGFRRFGRFLFFAALGLAIFSVFSGSVLDEILMKAPTWLMVMLLVALGFYLFRRMLSFFICKEGDSLLPIVMASFVRKIASWPAIIFRWLQVI